MKEASVAVEPIRLSVRVARPVAEAFDLFTRHMTEWWPHERLTFRANRQAESVLEPRVGGRLYERYDDGSEYTIGVVTAWDRPGRVAFTWKHPDWSASTEVVVTFVSEGRGTTRVELEHHGFDRLADATGWRERYTNGWPLVLVRYSGAANANSTIP